MGSGCQSILNTNTSPCANPVSSNCVKWQGPAIPALGICVGDTITEVDQVIIDKLLTLLDGTGIVLDQVTLANCPYLLNLFTGKDKTITNLFQLLIDTSCTYKTLIDELLLRTQASTTTFDLKCIGPITDPTLDKIVQALINEVCEQQEQIANLTSASGNTTIITNTVNSSLSDLITTNGGKGMKKTVDPNGLTHYHIFGMPIPGTYLPYGGALNVFDGSGKGIVGTAAEGWFLANGNNGTIDMRGFVPVGAVQGVPGPSLNPIVDPSGDPTMNYVVGQAGGAAKVVIDKTNLPNYTITGTFSGTATLSVTEKYTRYQDSASRVYMYGSVGTGGGQTPRTLTTNTFSGTTTQSLGGSSVPLENRMPYRALNWVVRFD